jgi:hypothetical protein
LLVLEYLITEIQALKETCIKAADEDNANGFLALELIAVSVQMEIQCCVKLKRDDVAAAWDALVAVERNLQNAMRVHTLAEKLSGYIYRIQALQSLLFPKQRFFSSGVSVESSTCSICGSEYEECEHIAGGPYMGQLCAQVAEKIKLLAVSLVGDPADKSCRIVSFFRG